MSSNPLGLEVVPFDTRYRETFVRALQERHVRDALGLTEEPSDFELDNGVAVTALGNGCERQNVRWWVILESGAATWGAIEYGWRGSLDVTRELDLFRGAELSTESSDVVWAMWCLARAVFSRRQVRRIRWQVRPEDKKSSIYRRLSFHELGQCSFEGDVRDVFELSRRRFEHVETHLREHSGRYALLKALRIT